MPTKRVIEKFSQSQFEPIKSFQLQDRLHPKVWDGYKLKPEISKDLIKLAKDYFEYLELGEGVELEDVIFTGSLANFNWSEYSDFDIHLIFDFSTVNKDVNLVKKFLDSAEKVWKSQHEIEIAGFPTELYSQDINDEVIATAQYSLFGNKWLVKPKREKFEIDEDEIRRKAGKFMQQIKDLESELERGETYREINEKFKKIWKRIKTARKAGLEGQGEFSIENLVFKLLRRNGYIARILAVKKESYDRQYK